MNNLAFLNPNLLWLAPVLLLLLLLASGRLGGLAPWRRRSALLLESFSVIALVVALAGPVLVKPDTGLNVVVVLDVSDSLSDASRAAATAYAKKVLAGAGSLVTVRFVAAGREAVLVKPEDVVKGVWPLVSSGPGGIQTNATDLAAGLRLAGTLLGDSGQRRLVLLSDGWETQGNAVQEAIALATHGIDVRVQPLSALGTDEVIARGLDTTPYARVGDTIWSNVDIYSTKETSATLQISVDGGDPATQTVSLHKGENNISLQQRANTEGFHRVTATIDGTSDTRKDNNTAGATLVVKPQPHVLVLQDRAGEASRMSDALDNSQMNTEIRDANTLPSEAGTLDDFDAIVLDNVAATSMTLDQQRTLQEFVRRYGKGLVVTGGQTSFAKGGYPDSVLEDVLPVSSHPAPRPEKGATALILIMDRSASMDDHIDMSGLYTKFSMAKDAALLAVDALRPGDTIGVLSFDTENLWAVPVQKIASDADKANIKSLINNVPIGNGTSIFPAVDEAARTIEQVSAPSKHLVLLTDGLDNSNERYEPIINGLQAAGVTLSTIGIGSDADKDLLTLLAKLGQGRYYFTEQPQNIPKIMFRELDLALKEATVEGQVRPHILSESPLLRGLAPQDIPLLGGYDITTSKPDAVLALVSDKGDPLLAHWNYGLGRVVAFTSDVNVDWAAEWLRWNDFPSFWSDAVRWSMSSPVNRQLQPSVTIAQDASGNNVAHLSAESLNPDSSFNDLANITAALRTPSGVVTNTLLEQTAPGRYEADVPLAQTGSYQAIFQRDGDNSISETAGFTVQPGEELLHAGSNDTLLQKIAGARGYLGDDPAAALDRKGLAGAAPQLQPLWEYFVAPALVLLLASVALRRIDFRLRRQ